MEALVKMNDCDQTIDQDLMDTVVIKLHNYNQTKGTIV